MENIFNRLQFVRGLNPNKESGVFDTREDAISYVIDRQMIERPSLVGEPIFLFYESGDCDKGPNVILAVGSVGNGTQSQTNRTFFIDTQKTEEEILELDEKLEDAIKSLTIIPLESDTIKMSAEKTDDGTLLSGDVKIADYRIVSGRANNNIIETEGDKGIYAFVDMDYDPETFIITFNVNGVTKEFQLLKDQHVEAGWYSPKDESIYLKLADGTKVKILVTELIEEWTVLPDGQTINEYNVSGTTVKYTPIVFYKTHVSADTTEHVGIYDYQDVLEADIRVADHIGDNILHKDRTGRYLYVKGTADNITYQPGVTVKDAIDGIDTRISTSTGNLIYKRADGIYATAMLDYNTAENKIIYRYSEGNTGELKEISFQLNSVKILEDITYDSTREVIVIRYIDAQGEYQKVEIPAADIIEEWTVNNEAHNIELNKYRSEGQGKDILTADAKIHAGNNNILEDLNHELYVNGISDNIKYDVTGSTTVKDVLDGLSAETDALNEEIGSGFSITNTVRDEINGINDTIEALSANTESRLMSVVNEDHSINVDNTDPVNPVLSVNLSSEIEDDKPNIIKLNNDGLYAGVDLSYIEEANKLIFKTTNGTKEIQLDSMSSIISIEYNPTKEAIVITYMTNGHEIKIVEIPVGDLINEWRVWDGHEGAIQLSKTRVASGTSEQDVLYAETVISNHEDNILTNDSGSLYVSGSGITANAAEIEQLKDRMDAAESDIDALQDGLNDAIDDLNAEIARSTAKDNELEDRLEDEIDRSISADTKLQNDINNEIVRATSAETALQTAINNEVTRATNEESRIETKLDNEIARSTSADTELQNFINDVASNLANETARAISAETSLQTALTEEIERATLAESTIERNLALETARATAAEEALQVAIDTETTNREHADSDLQSAIDSEVSRATTAENNLQTAISNETVRATSAETALQSAITNEIARANSAEMQIRQSISDETVARVSGDSSLQAQIDQESSRAQVAETTISERLTAEINRSTTEDQAIRGLLSAETAARQDADDELEDAIRRATLTFEDTPSIDFTKTSGNVVTADVKLQGGDNIIKLGQGLYATATLEYEPTGNKIRLVTSNGAQEYIQLVGATLLDSIEYDPVNKLLVIKYTDGNGSQRETSVGVTDLWNEWVTQNPSVNSAVELTKTIGDPGNPDTLSAKVLITDDRDGDGKPDDGSDNIIEIRNNGLYVDGSPISAITEITECTNSELKAVENAVFGKTVDDCGEGFAYEPPIGSTYINSATTLNDATYILDQSIKNLSAYTLNVENDVLAVSGNVECLRNELDVTQENVLGMAVPNCGKKGDGTPFTYLPNQGTNYIFSSTSFNNTDIILDREIKAANDNITILSGDVITISGDVINHYNELQCLENGVGFGGGVCEYIPDATACFISGATSLMEADKILDRAICSMSEDIEGLLNGADTVTTHMYVYVEDDKKLLKTDIRLSHGNGQPCQGDADVIITDLSDEEFSDTNALRIVDVTEQGYRVDACHNGLFLSNYWNCGEYTENGEGTPGNKYRIDDSESASNINYMNNVR